MSAARPPHLPGWPLVVFPVVALTAGALAGVQALNRMILPEVLALALSAGLGLACGFVTRWTQRGRTGVLRVVTAIGALTLGLLLLGLATGGQAGVDLRHRPSAGPDWIGLARFGVGTLAAGLALRAWRVRVTAEPRRPIWQRLADRVKAVLVRARNRLEEWLPLPWRRSKPATLPGRRAASQVAVSRAPKASTQAVRENFLRWLEGLAGLWERWLRPGEMTAPRLPNGRPRQASRSRRQRRLRIRLASVEEHRCPYCLEVVQPNDPRRVVVCPDCRTWHHADCWAVTGTCQVPHPHN